MEIPGRRRRRIDGQSGGPAPAGDWTGFYLGAQGGYTNFNASEDYANPSDQQDL